MSLIYSRPQELHVLAEHFGFESPRLLGLVELRGVSPVEIRNGVAMYDAKDIRELIGSVPNSRAR